MGDHINFIFIIIIFSFHLISCGSENNESEAPQVVSINGGMDWLYFDLFFTGGHESAYSSVTFPDRNTLVANGASTLFMSNDIGETWSDITPVFLDNDGTKIEIIIQSVFFLNENKGWIVANFNDPNENRLNRFVASTGDRGENWERIYTDTENDKIDENTKKIYFTDVNNGFVPENLLRTMDGGFTWQKSTSLVNKLDDFFFLDNENIWGISGSKIFKYSN